MKYLTNNHEYIFFKNSFDLPKADLSIRLFFYTLVQLMGSIAKKSKFVDHLVSIHSFNT